MPLALLLVSLSLLQGCIAPAVSDVIANLTPPFLDTDISLASSNSTSDTCKDIDNCRTIVGIVTSCIATIFACVWVAVRPNIPGPNQSWISRQTESAKVVVVTLLVPEWVLAWAVRQFLQARVYTKELEAARVEAAEEATVQHHRNSTQKGSTARYSSGDREGDQTHEIRLEEQSTSQDNLGKTMFPLENTDVLALVKSRALVPPTSDEIRDRCKGDSLSKTIAIFQALWFVTQCIARRVDNLVITNLEIMTLAYTVITVAMYAAWWYKPLNVHCPIRVKGDADGGLPQPFKPGHIIDYVIGDQDYHIRLSGEKRVPTFWSSCCHWNSDRPLYADIIALMVAMVFGAVHCAAWSYVFPSLEQQRMWRVCALAIAAIPLPMAAAFAVFNPFFTGTRRGIFNYIQNIYMPLGALLYIIARVLLLVLTITTLRDLPPSAYQTVQWTTWIPHV
ncbi:hypothetical protein FIBSPDRAFT_1002718 [Athelia psychrophila]|uniref:Integral membrane protein n=1 Tax=Athelia psychrophila TaxID=1759441 RepID=A0A167WJV3_9AGAM|nr:hypothetical protein FIBSPDRAFT_1002718 [Fibularhizoctonia sp. CBS 109695]